MIVDGLLRSENSVCCGYLLLLSLALGSISFHFLTMNLVIEAGHLVGVFEYSLTTMIEDETSPALFSTS